MDQPTFHQWLKRQGRSEEAAEPVIRLVAVYSDFLCSQTEHNLESAEPGELELFDQFVERVNFDGISPRPAEVDYSITTAQNLPQIVEYS